MYSMFGCRHAIKKKLNLIRELNVSTFVWSSNYFSRTPTMIRNSKFSLNQKHFKLTDTVEVSQLYLLLVYPKVYLCKNNNEEIYKNAVLTMKL